MITLHKRCALREIIYQVVEKKVTRTDVHIACMNLTKENLKDMYNDYLNKKTSKITLLVVGKQYYKKHHGIVRYESNYKNFFIDFKTMRLR